MNKEEPKVLTRMRLSCCWGDNLNEKELNEVVDYINLLQEKVNQLETNRDEAIKELEILRNRLLYEEDFCMEEVHIDEAKAILERGKE